MMTRMHNIYSFFRNHCAVVALSLVLLIFSTSSAYCILANIGASYNHDEYLEYCGADVYAEKYDTAATSCWSCEIIDTMFQGLKTVIVIMAEKIEPLCFIIIVLGGAIWLAMYLLKALGSFATQESGKVLDGILMTMFKIALVYTLIAAGINEIKKEKRIKRTDAVAEGSKKKKK